MKECQIKKIADRSKWMAKVLDKICLLNKSCQNGKKKKLDLPVESHHLTSNREFVLIYYNVRDQSDSIGDEVLALL